MEWKRILETADRNYSPERFMLGEDCREMGYHSCLKKGQRVHPTRESLQYALVLLATGEGDNATRAVAVLWKVLSLQDTDPFSGTYGVWPWYDEESLTQMNPPDWNWADFCGARIAQILRDHKDRLPADLILAMRTALGHAAGCIYRRNVRLDYTNIAVMGGGVAGMAGEILGEPRLLDFGRERLRRVVELTRYHESFTEYNSPTYTMVVLEECERILHLVRDAELRAAAEQLRVMAWEVIAEHFHPPTNQWAGPHARAYSNHLSAAFARYFSEQTGVDIPVHPKAMGSSGEPSLPSLIPPLPCPANLQVKFRMLPCDKFEFSRCFIRREDPGAKPPERYSSDSLVDRGARPVPRYWYGDRVGTTWLSGNAALGSVNHEDTWNQRRFLIGYFKTEQDPAAVLRLRFLHNGRDFCSGYIRNAQKGPRVLSALSLLSNRGDWHPVFDHPEGDIFQAEDFRLRYELTGRGVSVEKRGELEFIMGVGIHRIRVCGSRGSFGGQEVTWECGVEEGAAWVDAVCYQGPSTGFHFQTMGPVQLAGGVEWLEPEAIVESRGIAIEGKGGEAFEAAWSGLSLRVPGSLDVYPA